MFIKIFIKIARENADTRRQCDFNKKNNIYIIVLTFP